MLLPANTNKATDAVHVPRPMYADVAECKPLQQPLPMCSSTVNHNTYMRQSMQETLAWRIQCKLGCPLTRSTWLGKVSCPMALVHCMPAALICKLHIKGPRETQKQTQLLPTEDAEHQPLPCRSAVQPVGCNERPYLTSVAAAERHT
jgi:hypothetical protein